MTTLNTIPAAEVPSGKETPPARASGPRFDIQGLRAFAVLAVILDHLTGWPGGGFVGVDIFFVISGFLITGVLLRRHESTGRVSPGWFYGRRFKRIMPTAVLVIVVTLVASYLTFAQVRFDQIKGDAVAALFFVSNWRFESQKLDYFNADRAISPLQHYWSLSIEEQFYFVWPWLMVAIFAVLLGRNATRRHAHIVVGAVMAVVVVASFGWAVVQTGSDAHSAYFSSLTRVWELGLGAFLAVVAGQLARIPNKVRPWFAWLGLAGMVASLWLITGDQGFPAPAAALPVLSTALVIAAGTRTDGEQTWIWPLTNPLSNYIGDMSYSLYLWHFPIIIIGAALIGESAGDKVVLGVAIACISYFSYELYENPLRHVKWFGRKRGVEPLDDVYKFKALAALAVVALVFCGLALNPVDPPESALAQAGAKIDNDTIGDPVEQPHYGPVTTALQGQIVTALGATSWPDLTPSMDEAIASRQAPDDVMDCGLQPVDETACTWGDPNGDKTLMIVGDSVAMSYVEAFRTALGADSGWQVKSYAAFGCPFVDATLENDDAELLAACPDRKTAAVDAINRIKPDLLVIANGYGPRYPVGSATALTPAEWTKANTDMISQVQGAPGKVAFLASPPYERDPSQCYTKASGPADCVNRVIEDWQARADTEQALAMQVPGAVWVDSRPWFCAQDLCPAFVGDTPVHEDAVHMSQWYSAKIGPAVREYLDEQKLLKPTGL